MLVSDKLIKEKQPAKCNACGRISSFGEILTQLLIQKLKIWTEKKLAYYFT